MGISNDPGVSAWKSAAIAVALALTSSGWAQTQVVRPLAPALAVPNVSQLRLAPCADICVQVLGLSSARITWATPAISPPGTSLVKYWVVRSQAGAGDVTIEVSPSAGNGVVDGGLRDNTTYSYQVKAIGPPRTEPALPVQGAPAGQAPNVTIQNPLIGWSGTASVRTPPLVAPAQITASVDPAQSGLVHLSWPAAAYAPYYQVFRDKVAIGTAVTGTISTDAPPPGWHDYSVASVATEVGMGFSSPPTNPATLHVGPFRMLAVGDSIMWGQGLLEPHKFVNLVTSWLSTNLGVPVFTTNLAHSGAEAIVNGNLESPPLTPSQIAQNDATDATVGGIPNSLGEVPNTYPQVMFQATTMGPTLGDPNSVDLILADGCINDVGVSRVLDPTVSDATLNALIGTDCGSSMSQLLTALHGKYPRARIVVPSYFKIVSNQSDLLNLAVLAMQAGVSIPAIASLIGVPVPPDPGTASAIILTAGPIALQKLKDFEVMRSTNFVTSSTALLQADVQNFNASHGGQMWTAFAQVPFTDANSYGTQSSSWLWPVPISIPAIISNPQDEAYGVRQSVCRAIPANNPDYDRTKCPVASMGHPNVTGAQQYANAIEGQLQNFLPMWRATLAPTQTSH